MVHWSALIFGLVVSAEASFNPLQHSGPASPYFDAPSRYDIDADAVAPLGCKVDQAAYILRHGSRYAEPGSLKGWQSLYAKVQNATFDAYGPLRFIGAWTVPEDDIEHMSPSAGAYLSTTGAREAFDLGRDLRLRYGFTPGGDNLTIYSAGQQRCVDTATFFLRGYLSQGNYANATGNNRGHIVTLPDSVKDAYFADSLTPSSACPAYSAANNGSAISDAYRATFRQAIADRLNKYLKGNLVFEPSDIGVMQDLCGFGTQVSGWKAEPFCKLFTEKEWLDYEYAHDLNYYYGAGPGNALSATVGYSWVKAISDLLASGPGATSQGGDATPAPLIMSFTHDNNIPPIMSALGLWNSSALDPLHPNPKREFRSSYLVPFRGTIALERLTCIEDAAKDPYNFDTWSPITHSANTTYDMFSGDVETAQYVRVRVNNAPVPIPGCQSGPGKACALASFGDHVAKMGRIAGGFAERCGLTNATGNTDELTFYTHSGAAGASTVLAV
ncbi:phosphoglycerate mutase-like protein [Cylindrobasidium torrendii FP15055 ss-10]|uniref:Phosphoglycerate mutase-like protein n=1 Tax=Cylindrobasidium torrendii FP15055 ss-10 TaxID=1314674 RepID=A0A0D7BKE5_9AGAR|nr:phosphoglycerate mutase-like protein [Cylindrobasidium torrendii FP15055 ss-10]